MWPGRAPDHALGLGADRDDGVGRGVDGDDGRLVEQDAASAGVDQGVGRAEVDRQVTAEQVAAALRHQRQPRQRGDRHGRTLRRMRGRPQPGQGTA